MSWFSYICDRTPGKRNLRKEKFSLAHGWRAQFIMAGKTWLEELEEASQPESAGSERDNTGAWLAFSFPIFIFSLISNQGVGAAHIQGGFSLLC